MTDKRMLIGSLSNDLQRVASLTQRGSDKAALRFFIEAQRWVGSLKKYELPSYIKKIIFDLSTQENIKTLDLDLAEKHLMYSILLQNYSLQID